MLEAWKLIGLPSETGARNVRIADSNHPLDFRMGRDNRGNFVFLLDVYEVPRTMPSFPKFAGIAINLEIPAPNRARLVFVLQDKTDFQNFALLCTSLMLATRSISSNRSSEGLTRTLEELRRWEEMLKRRRENRLTRIERIGLIGELLFLRDELLPRIGIGEALLAWVGQDKHEQDFVIGSTIFEVKTQVVTSDRMIGISSEDQLDAVQGKILICNQGIAPSPANASGSCTLNSLANELGFLARRESGAASDLFEIGLLRAGYESYPEYDEEIWTLVDRVFYEVRDEFPRIERKDLRTGVEQVRYKIRVSDCQPFTVDSETIFRELHHA
jgi:hypothetical protein